VHSYYMAGLSISSEIALPGLLAQVDDGGPGEISIRRDTVASALNGEKIAGLTWQMSGDHFLLRIPNVARFLVTGGSNVAFETENNTPVDDIAIFLVGTVLGILLHQRGRIALRASAVQINGKAVLFCGRSRAGKSTIAAALTQRGYPLVTDNLCVVATAGATPMALPEGGRLQLWARAIESLDLRTRRGAPVRAHIEKYYVDPLAATCEALPLGAIYVLREARPPLSEGIDRRPSASAPLLLLRHIHLPLLVKTMKREASYFKVAIEIANAVGFFNLTRCFEFVSMPVVISWLEQHWREMALAERAT
jgi:hypothetical protein